MRTYRHAVVRLIEEGRQDGSLRPSLDPGITAMALLGALNWMHRWFRPTGPWPVDRVADQLVALLVAGISPGGGVSEVAPTFAMPARSRPDRRDRHGAIMDAAARLFVARGYESTTLAEVAEASGVSKPTLYHYVASKDRLLFDLVRDRQERASAVLGGLEALDADPRAKLIAAIRFHVRAIIATPLETQLVLEQSRSLVVEHRAEMRRLQARYFDAFAAIVAATRPAPEATRDDLATLVALGACNWVYRWYRPGRWSADEIAEGFADVLLDGVGRMPRQDPAIERMVGGKARADA
jgi:AcrR family transcriptional regulator